MTHDDERARFLAALERVRARLIVLDANVLATLHARISAGVGKARRRLMPHRLNSYVSTGDLARAAGVSIPYIRDCIERDELAAVSIGHGKIKRARIHLVEAVRFLDAKGFTVPRDWRKLAAELA